MTSIFDFQSLIKSASAEEAQAKYLAVLEALGVTTAQWSPSSVLRTYIAGTSVMVAASSEVMALATRSGYLELSEGDWLTIVAHYVYGVDRNPATFASGKLTLVNGGGALYSLGPGDLIVRCPATNTTYRNEAAFTLQPLATLTDVAIVALEAGSGSSAAAGAINELVTTLLNVTVTNPSSVVGDDVELDPQLRDRCYSKLGSLSPFGPWDAYRYAATNAKRADGSSCGVTRTQNDRDGYGNQYTYVATDSGGVPGTVGDLTTDLGRVDDAIQRWAAPQVVVAHTIGATDVEVAVTYEAWMYNTAPLTAAEAVEHIEAALRAAFAALPVGGASLAPGAPGYVYRDAVLSAIDESVPEIFHVQLTAPSTDRVLAIGQVATLGVVTGVVHLVPPTGGFGGS
jgi:hypothetical protein